VVTADREARSLLILIRSWTGDLCRSELVNDGPKPVKLKEILLFKVPHALPPELLFYGEGFQMLSQTGGTIGKPENLGACTDRKHYRMPQPDDAAVAYGVVTLAPPGADRVLLGFTTTRRFAGRFHVRPGVVEGVLDTEGFAIAPGERWKWRNC
jgi:alpha-galactosidase